MFLSALEDRLGQRVVEPLRVIQRSNDMELLSEADLEDADPLHVTVLVLEEDRTPIILGV